MDCREFQRIHPDLLDEALWPDDLNRAHSHMVECKSCASQDTSIRRALLVFRNIQPIEPSPQFSKRLHQRLAQSGAPQEPSFSRLPLFSAFAVAAGLLLMVAVADNVRSPAKLTLPPALVSLPEPATSHFVTPTIAVSMSAGFPAWPALLMAEQASQQLADAEFRFAGYTPR